MRKDGSSRSSSTRSRALVLGALVMCAVLVSSGASAQQDLLVDSGFDDSSLSAWNIEVYDTSTVEWSAVDAAGDAVSGSVYVAKKVGENPNSARVRQCRPVTDGTTLEFSARILVPDQTAPGNPYLYVGFWTEEGCDGEPNGNLSPSGSVPADTWTMVGPVEVAVPAGTQSVEVLAGATVTVALGSLETFEVYLDDVRLVPGPGAGAGSVAGTLALTGLARRRGEGRTT